MANWPWECVHFGSGVPVDDFEHLQRWLTAIEARPAVQAGVSVLSGDNFDLLTGRAGNPDAVAKEPSDLVQNPVD